MFWYKLKNESACTCQNTDWFQFWRSNMTINAKNNQWSKPVKTHLLSCLDVRGAEHLIGQV